MESLSSSGPSPPAEVGLHQAVQAAAESEEELHLKAPALS